MKKIYSSIIICCLAFINVFAQTCSTNITSGTNNQTVCVNTAITTVTYSVSSSATVSGLPPGVIFDANANLPTISGTPTQSGIYTYTLTNSAHTALPILPQVPLRLIRMPLLH